MSAILKVRTDPVLRELDYKDKLRCMSNKEIELEKLLTREYIWLRTDPVQEAIEKIELAKMLARIPQHKSGGGSEGKDEPR